MVFTEFNWAECSCGRRGDRFRHNGPKKKSKVCKSSSNVYKWFIIFSFVVGFSRQGQTQSQYLNFGDNGTDGKADAEITRFGSRASVCKYFFFV